jgi:hypothetical protein
MIQRKYAEKFPNILSLVDLICTLSPSSAEAERGFSQLKIIKTSLRSRLNQLTLNQVLCIKLHSQDILHFNPEPAIQVWNTSSTRQRRPCFQRKKSKDTEVGKDFNMDGAVETSVDVNTEYKEVHEFEEDHMMEEGNEEGNDEENDGETGDFISEREAFESLKEIEREIEIEYE